MQAALSQDAARTENIPKKSYGQALKSSALIGASSLMEIGFRIVRAKSIAILVGPAGTGLLGIYSSIAELARNLCGMGLNTSGVRQIAEAAGSGDAQRISCTAITLKRLAFFTGALGALLLFLFSGLISQITFGNANYAGAIALLAIVLFCSEISEAQAALVQGMRRIPDLARITVWGAAAGTVLTVGIIYYFRENGLVPSLVAVAVTGLVASWWFARKIEIKPVSMTLHLLKRESSALLKLGAVFMASGFMLMCSAYLVRLIVLRKIGVDAAGFFQAAWALGGIYTAFIMRAMAADFFPRLTAVADDNAECNRLSNEQAEVVLLLACPGIIATLVLAPIAIGIFYSKQFAPATEILQWICLGMLLRLASWSIGFIMLAKGARKSFFWSEFFSNAALVGFVWSGVSFFGLNGVGIGFFAMNFIYAIAIYLIIRQLSGFRWSAANRRLGLVFAPLVAAAFLAFNFLPRLFAMIFGCGIIIFAGVYSLKELHKLIPADRLPQMTQKAFKLFGMTSEKSRLQ